MRRLFKPGLSLRETLLWPNRLALDAALVGVGWLGAFSAHLVAPMTAPAYLVLAASIWLVYGSDRWLDSRNRYWKELPTARHQLAARWRGHFLSVWMVILVATIATALISLDGQSLAAGSAVLALCLIHTACSQRPAVRRLTKELCVGVIFGAGTGVFFAGSSLPPADTFALLIGLLALAIACFANCVLVARWEVTIDQKLGRQSLALALGRRSSRLGIYAWLTAFTGLVAGFFLWPALGLCAYGLLLGGIDGARWPRNLAARRALADGSLAVIGFLFIFLA